ncbi:MAG TPA: ATP-binding protein [Pyrinomonadaceae bacterium]|nr:ATP-binding protein [Pyrinomonadaceae bacterium]
MGSSPATDAPETSQTRPGRGADSSRPAPPQVAPAVNLRAYALAGIAAHVSSGGSLSEESPEIQFLLAHLGAVDPLGKGWAAGLPEYLRRPDAQDALLFYCARELGLTVMETLAVALAASVEEDVMIGRALAYLQSPLGGSRPTLGLVAASFGETAAAGAKPINLLLSGAAVRSGLLVLSNEGPPLPERTASVPLHLCLALNGHDGSLAGTRVGLGQTPEVSLPDSVLDEARRHSLSLLNSEQKALVVRTGSTAEGETVAVKLAEAMSRRALFIETEKITSLCPWLILRRLLPVFRFELAPGERKILPALPFYGGPVLALCGPDGSVEAAGGAALSWALQVPREDERALLWRSALGDEQLASSLARQHRHGSGRIAHLGRLARHRCAARGSALPAKEDVVAAAWVGEGSGLDALAQPITSVIPDEALVVPPLLREELRTLLLRCRARDQLSSGLGASLTARYHPGVRALFVGPSGTGKTLAAGWLATKLGIPLYRVDLASVTSKYIGETEKNLSQLLARAEAAEVLLLFDEADSLFGKRTDVREANDRFANAQTNYLLQRIESFDGITLLTSNSRARFDTALARRLDMIVEFPAPGPEERRSLWQSHLGPDHGLAQRELNQLAAVADLCGGNIRNVVLTAAVLAQEREGAIGYADIVEGLRSEYRKLGRQVPVELQIAPHG